MSIISLKFLIFLFFSVLVYYIFPKKYRWFVLLVFSIIFFICASSVKLISCLLIGIITTYIGTRAMCEICKTKKQRVTIYVLTLLSIIIPLFIFKYMNIIPITANHIGKLFNIHIGLKTINLIAPLGISYYTLSLISYVTDVYWTTCKAEKNILKHALFACYYPVMISGPIIRYPQMKETFFAERKIDWNNIYYGFYRIVYGLMKKVVIADLLYQIVDKIFTNYNQYSGVYIVLGVMCYAIQIYCDFSGCMDIVIGASKMYGVTLPENFESPFFSRTLGEFWRRWHITLGTWSKDYIMYPLLKTKFFQKMGKGFKKILGKKIGKKIPTILAIFILWLIIGLWHGTSYRYIFAAGILPWIYLTIGEFTEDTMKKLTKKLHINTECFSFRLFQSIRTFLLMCFVWLFVCAPSLKKSTIVIGNIFKPTDLGLFNSLPQLPMIIIFAMLIIVAIVDYLKYNNHNVLEIFKKQNLVFRWITLLLLIVVILMFGSYGPAYNPVDFIYGGF